MKKSGYLKRQQETNDKLLAIGMELGQQQIFDALALALHDKELMGSNAFGSARIKAVCTRVQEIVNEFSDAFSPCAEQDYMQERFDRAIRAVFGAEAQPFAVRYPYIKEQKYRRNKP